MYPGDYQQSLSDERLQDIVKDAQPAASENMELLRDAYAYLRTRQGNVRQWTNGVRKAILINGVVISDEDARQMFCKCVHCVQMSTLC